MNRRSFFRSIGLAVAAATSGFVLLGSKPKDVWYAPSATPRGYKGSEFLKAGIIYAPYIPLYVTSEIYVNTEFTNRFNSHKGIPYTADKKAFERHLDKCWQAATMTV